MIITDLADEIDQEIAETDMATGSALQTGGDAGVETEIIVTGETTLMIWLEGAARTLLTRGPVAEVMAIQGNLQAEPKA
jgi:hypothetical protein